MGRSVSTPRDAIVSYYDVSEQGYGWDEENNCVDYDRYCEWQAEDEWGFFKECMVEKVKKLFPSMSECEEWLDREDLAIAENGHAYFGVSEYCGCAAVWIVAKTDYYGDEQPLAEAWVKRVAAKFDANFGDYRKIGTFSNGESVYEQKKAA